MRRVMVGGDRSETSDQAVEWAASLAARCDADLYIVQVISPEHPSVTAYGAAERTRADAARSELAEYAQKLAGPRGHALVVIDPDPAIALVRAAEKQNVDVLVVGNLGMAGRKEFLLGNVPNRVSHNARCTVIIVNTSGRGSLGVLEFSTQTTAAPPVERKLASRGAHIALIMAKHGLKELFNQADEDGTVGLRRKAKRLRLALEELGPTFSKLGQILSTRPDLLPPEYIEELAALQDKVPPMPETDVVSVMEKELGVPWEDVFDSIDPRPLAAGTIGQVHRATLVGGDRVVVKVQRPNARIEIEQDLALFQAFVEAAENRPQLKKIVDLGAVFGQLSQSLQRELDFCQEAANIDRMREVLARYDRLAAPAVHKDLSTSRFLVMEEIQGGPISQAPEGRERREAARQLLESFYEQIVSHGFFHADPHPGNLKWWNDRIYFLDFGMVGNIGDELRQQLMLLLMAFWREDSQFLTDVTLMISGSFDASALNVARLQGDIGALMTKYRRASLAEMQIGPIFQEMSEIAMRHGVPLPASLTLVGKALAQVQLATAQLDPTLDPFDVAGKFLTKVILKSVRDSVDPKALLYESQKLKVRVVRMIDTMERLIGARPGQSLAVNFMAHSLEDTVRRTGRRLILGLIAAASIFAAGFASSSASAGSWAPLTFGALSGVLTLGLLIDLTRR